MKFENLLKKGRLYALTGKNREISTLRRTRGGEI